jgi:hypothetical protein
MSRRSGRADLPHPAFQLMVLPQKGLTHACTGEYRGCPLPPYRSCVIRPAQTHDGLRQQLAFRVAEWCSPRGRSLLYRG